MQNCENCENEKLLLAPIHYLRKAIKPAACNHIRCCDHAICFVLKALLFDKWLRDAYEFDGVA